MKKSLVSGLMLAASLSAPAFAADVWLDTVNCNPYGQVVVRSHTGATWPARAYQGSWNSSANNGGVRCTFTIPEDGTYKLWGRMITDNGVQPYYVDLNNDGGNEGTWSSVSGAQSSFQWTDSGASRYFTAGQHKLNLTLRAGEDNTRLDYLLLTTDSGMTPSGEGQPEVQQYADHDFQADTVSVNGHLHASNGRLYNQHNQEVQLQGIGLHGLQWFPTRERNTIPHMVETWGAEVVRLAMYIEEFPSDLTTYASDDYWGGWSSNPDRQQYMEEQVDRIVKEAVKAGIYVKLTWHIHDDPIRWLDEAKDFFGRMSAKYGMLPNVMFEPCNEPLGRDWSGSTSIRSFATEVIQEIRANDPDGIDNMVIVGTPFYSANIQDVTGGDGLLDDPNVAYSLHHYAYSHDETAKINDAVGVKNAGGLPWLSEWSPASYNITDIDLVQGADLVNKMNQHNFSSTVWSMSNKIETSSLLDGSANMWGPWSWNDMSQVGQWFKNNSVFPGSQQYGYHFDTTPTACSTNCITDNDNDGVIDQYFDQCLNTPAGAQIDENGCALVDSDGDGVTDGQDAFPYDATEWADTDGDGMGDNSDMFPFDSNETIDTDGDGVGDNGDAFPSDPNESADSDGDGLGDNADELPNDPNETQDSDNDGVGNNTDLCPGTPANAPVGSDGCELPETELHIGAEDYTNAYDTSAGNSGTATNCTYNGMNVDVNNNGTNNCNIGWTANGEWLEYSINVPATGAYQLTYSHGGESATGSIQFRNSSGTTLETTSLASTGSWAQYRTTTDNGLVNLNAGTQTIRLYIATAGFNLDYFELASDLDNDGVFGNNDLCGSTPSNDSADSNGCGASQKDSDNDGVNDALDAFPNDATETMDSDGDGMGDNADLCDATVAGVDIDSNGCYIFIDSDGDNVPNYRDSCPSTSAGATVNVSGCTVNAATILSSTGNFNSTENFIFFVDSGYSGSLTINSGNARAVLNQSASDQWKAQIIHNVGLTQGQQYTTCFDAKADSTARTVLVTAGGQQDSNYANRMSEGGAYVNITTSWASYAVTWTSNASDSTSEIALQLAHSDKDLRIDNVKLVLGASCSAAGNDDDFDGVVNGSDSCAGTAIGELVDTQGCSLAPDSDDDGIIDDDDSCPNTPAGAVVDTNGCPMDSDNDGVFDGLDSCANTPNGESVDASGCSSSQIDSDNDGVMDNADVCANTPNGESVDAFGCSASQVDTDNDGVYDNADNCANTPSNETADANGCSDSQRDSDNDGVMDNADSCANTPNGESVNASGCSASQIDDDNDGVMNNADLCANTPNGESVNGNGCSSSQIDSDNDGIMDNADACANTPNGESVNASGCAWSQLDDDNDGVSNGSDSCANTPNGESVNASGCAQSQIDDDNDGVMNNADSCANTPNGASVDANGCAWSQLDDDNDGVLNGSDSCANTPNGESVNGSGCSQSQIDDDNDGVMNNADQCANTPNGQSVNGNGCSSSQLDDDNDGVMNNADQCPNTSAGASVDSNGCEIVIPTGVWVEIKNVNSNLCLDVAAASHDNGANVQQWSCNGTGAQKWRLTKTGSYYTIQNQNSGKYLDGYNNNVHQWAWANAAAQKWRVTNMGNGQFTFEPSSNLGKCLRAEGGQTHSGANINRTDNCSGWNSQKFYFD